MSLSGALTVALSGLQTSTTAAQIISGNISNSHTVGYTVKSVELSAITSGSTLGGVEVTGYGRVSNSVLAATLNSSTSTSAYLSTQDNYMSQVQSILDSTDSPPALSADVSAFQAAWTEYSAAPSDLTLQKTVVSTGQALASTINSISTQTTLLETNIKNDLSTTISSLNTALKKIQTLNTEITTALASNQPTVNLEDARDQAINEVAKYTNVTVMSRANGQVALYTSGGTALIDGEAQVFSVGAGGNTIVNAVSSDVTASLTGGTLQAQTDFLSSSTSTTNGVGVINKMQDQILALANMFVSTATGGFADIYNSAVTATGEQASSFFTATTDANGNITDLTSFSVNASLISGATSVKTAAATAIANTFTATNLAINTTTTPATTSSSFTAAGISLQNQTYGNITTAILSGFQQAANAIKSQSATASTQQAYYKSSLSSQTGVNTDTELVNLTNWENSYAASAHVISTIQTMMKTLENMVG